MSILKLIWDKTSKSFSTEMTVPRDLLVTLKEHGILENVIPGIFPETFQAQIIIDPKDYNFTTHHKVVFYTEVKNNAKMAVVGNEDINPGDPEGEKVWFEIDVLKLSDVVEEDKQTITLTFN